MSNTFVRQSVFPRGVVLRSNSVLAVRPYFVNPITTRFYVAKLDKVLPRRDSFQVLCCEGESNQRQETKEGLSRRSAVISIAGAVHPILLSSVGVSAEEVVEENYTSRAPAPQEPEGTPQQPQQPEVAAVAPSPASQSDLKKFITREFLFQYPPSFEKEELSDSFLPSSTIGTSPQLLYNNAAPPPNPLQVKLFNQTGVTVSVAVRLASTMRPTLFQVNDISQFGELEEVAQLVVPPGSTVTRFYTQERISPAKKQNPGDKQAKGLVKKYYTYQFNRGNTTGLLCAAAKSGKVYVMLVSAPKDDPQIELLQSIADTFKVRS